MVKRQFRVISKENIEITLPCIERHTSPFLFNLPKHEEISTLSLPDVSISSLMRFVKTLNKSSTLLKEDVLDIYKIIGMSLRTARYMEEPTKGVQVSVNPKSNENPSILPSKPPVTEIDFFVKIEF